MDLGSKAWLSLALLAIAMGALLFVSAGSLVYWQAWLYLAVFFGPSTAATLDLLRRDPALLKRRLNGGPMAEKRIAQKIIMLFTSASFMALLVVPGLDHRYGWSATPAYMVIAGTLSVLVGFILIMRVYRENPFTSATIEVAADQRVISTGPYAYVRHPMYASALFYLVGTPLTLGSYWGLLALAVMLPFLVWRLFDEERFLTRDLPGYSDYLRKVRWRLIPGIF